jgi:hypothetical protein
VLAGLRKTATTPAPTDTTRYEANCGRGSKDAGTPTRSTPSELDERGMLADELRTAITELLSSLDKPLLHRSGTHS